MSPIEVYRVNRWAGGPWPDWLVDRIHAGHRWAILAGRRLLYKPWRRTWQAEWPGCHQAPRAWTRWGVERKAARWIAERETV
jgi:hypothetical protein